MNTEQELIIVWEAPKITPPEFRLYYDEQGKVVCYTCEKLEGNYIVIDARTFAEGRPDVRVINGKISTVNVNAIVSKLMPDTDGQLTSVEDISIIVDSNYKGKTTTWKIHTYELK
jgi:hypothetical protein